MRVPTYTLTLVLGYSTSSRSAAIELRQSEADQPGIDVPIPWHLVMKESTGSPTPGVQTSGNAVTASCAK
ncbi:hypothetical protein HMPREF9619_01655 [Cutibacterium acnes HL082PA2]|nr:hypothetical protein HMPREF9619_01655 [Cutibacterium acnes HL082PA2]